MFGPLQICNFYSKMYPNDMIIVDESEFLGELPPTLRTIVVHQLYAETVERVPIFKALETDTREQICQCLQPIMFAVGDNIMREGDKAEAMYFIMVNCHRYNVSIITAWSSPASQRPPRLV